MSYCVCDTDIVMYVIYFTLQVELIVDSANPRIGCLEKNLIVVSVQAGVISKGHHAAKEGKREKFYGKNIRIQ